MKYHKKNEKKKKKKISFGQSRIWISLIMFIVIIIISQENRMNEEESMGRGIVLLQQLVERERDMYISHCSSIMRKEIPRKRTYQSGRIFAKQPEQTAI